MNPVVFKEAKQSSLHASKHLGEWMTADKAINGDNKAINGDKTGDIISHTKLEANPWWEVKLWRTFAVSKVVIYNRTATHREYLIFPSYHSKSWWRGL